MRLLSALVSAALVLGLAPAVGPASPAAAATQGAPCVHKNGPANSPIVWAVGDSLTAQYAPCLWERNPTWRVRNFGKGGETSAAAVNRVRELITRTQRDTPQLMPDVAVLAWGVNDVIRREALGLVGYSTGEIVNNIVTIRDMFLAAGVKVVVATPFTYYDLRLPPSDPRYSLAKRLMDGMTDVRKSLARYGKASDPAIRIRPIVHLRIPEIAMPSDFIIEDGIHATPRGTRYMARKITSKVKKLLNS